MNISSASAKTLILAVCLLFSIGGALAFPSSLLGSAAHNPSSGALTVAGQTNGCSQYRDESGTFTGSISIVPKQLPALIDIYYVTSTGGWNYYNEFTAPLQFTGGNRQYAYEVYYCPVTPATCGAGQFHAVTETTYQACVGGTWGPVQQCSVGSYFNPASQACISPACQEQWTCGNWGSCTQAGFQYRSCSDVKSCGTYTNEPSTSQACTPTTSTGGTVGVIRNGISLTGWPIPSTYSGASGTPITVSQQFSVTQAGQYWVEVGIEQNRGLAIATVAQNTCDPAQTWYANQLVNFPSTGNQTVTFQVTPPNDGTYTLHSAVVTGCAGDVVQQVTSTNFITIGTTTGAGTQSTGSGLPFYIAGAAIILVGGYFLVKK